MPPTQYPRSEPLPKFDLLYSDHDRRRAVRWAWLFTRSPHRRRCERILSAPPQPPSPLMRRTTHHAGPSVIGERTGRLRELGVSRLRFTPHPNPRKGRTRRGKLESLYILSPPTHPSGKSAHPIGTSYAHGIRYFPDNNRGDWGIGNSSRMGTLL